MMLSPFEIQLSTPDVTGNYIVTGTINQAESNTMINTWGCEGDTSQPCAGDCMYDDSDDSCSGHLECDILGLGQ